MMKRKSKQQFKPNKKYDVAFSTIPPHSLDKEANAGISKEAEGAAPRSANVNEGWPTTRCYPRTTDEAFQHLGESAEWWFPPEQRAIDKVFFWVSLLMCISLAVYLWKTK